MCYGSVEERGGYLGAGPAPGDDQVVIGVLQCGWGPGASRNPLQGLDLDLEGGQRGHSLVIHLDNLNSSEVTILDHAKTGPCHPITEQEFETPKI